MQDFLSGILFDSVMKMKLYAKIKRNGKWTMVPAASIRARVDAHDRCECRVCAYIKGGLHEEE